MLLILLTAFIGIQLESAIAQTFPLNPGWYIEKYAYLQANDHIVGNFTVNDLLTYNSTWGYPWITPAPHTYWVDVVVIDPEYNHVLNYTKVSGDILYSFDYSAIISGKYTFQIYCSNENFPPEALAPKMILYYDIISNYPNSSSPSATSSPAPTLTPSPSSSPIPITTPTPAAPSEHTINSGETWQSELVMRMAIVVVLIVGISLVYWKKSKHKAESTNR